MTHPIRLLLSLLLFLAFVIPAFADDTDDAYIARAKTIMNSYRELIEGHPDKEAHFVAAWDVYSRDWAADRTSVAISYESMSTWLPGASLNTYDGGARANVVMTADLIDLWETHPSFVYAVLTHEIWHYRDFATAYDHFRDAATDPYEEVMYEMDAYYVEAMFIDRVIVPAGFELSRFEDFLLRCYRSNSLWNFSNLFQQVDLRHLHHLYHLKGAWYRGDVDRAGVYEDLEAYTLKVLEENETSPDESDWVRYSKMIAVKSYNRFLFLFIDTVEARAGIYKTYDDFFVDYPVFARVNEATGEIEARHLEELNTIRDGILASFALP